MAANPEEITLEAKRCIFVADHIYFSNYYLKSKMTEPTVRVNSVNKIIFDDSQFMNKTMIQDVNKKTVSNQLEITGSLLPNLSNLNESLYSKVNISNKSIEITVAENDILPLKIENKSIFKDNEQIKQFLKYDGWWCPAAERIEFDDKDGTKEAKLVDMTILPVIDRIAAASNARSQDPAQVKQVADALKGANNVNIVTSDDDPDPPNEPQPAQQQIIGGSKQTRSTRNHKNRKSKKN
jgi:hypothetical protein